MKYDEILKDKKLLGRLLKQRRINLNVTKSRIKVVSGINYNTIMAIEAGSTGYTIDSLIFYLNAMKKIKELKKLRINKNTEKHISFDNNFSVFDLFSENIII